eukprot:gene1777-2113_t
MAAADYAATIKHLFPKGEVFHELSKLLLRAPKPLLAAALAQYANCGLQWCTAGRGAGPRQPGVDSLLNGVVDALADNPDRTFTYAELALFISWWQQLHPETQNSVRWLVKEGQFEFVNGGLVQHDEATSHYSAMIDQMTLGMRFLQMEFGVSPKVAWQLSGQGHSTTEPLLKSMAGFEAIYIRGTDKQDAQSREQRKLLELIWRGSMSYPTSSDLLLSEFASSSFASPVDAHNLTWFSELPRGTHSSWQEVFSTLNDDPETQGFNLDKVMDAFVATAEQLHSYTSGNDVLLLLDPDFMQVDPLSWFSNVDKLVHYAKHDGRVNAFYSTPSAYFAARAAHSAAAASAAADASNVGHLEGWALKTDDFFPGQGFLVVAYNPLAFSYSWGLRIPVAKDPTVTFSVFDPQGVVVPAQLLPMAESTAAWDLAGAGQEQEELAFVASVPALGHAVYKVLQHMDRSTQDAPSSSARTGVQSRLHATAQRQAGITYDNDEEESDDSNIAVVSDVFLWERLRSVIVSSDSLEVVLKPRFDAITQVRNIATGATWQYSHEIILYQDNTPTEATAAAFAATSAPRRAIVTSITLVKGPVVQEIRETFRDVGVLTTRLWNSRNTLEVQWVVHKLPPEQNTEVLLRYNTGLKPEHGVWFTDANGREWQQRRPNYRPSYKLQHPAPHPHRLPLGSNMYPANTGFTIKDSHRTVSVAIDRAQGVASLMPGVLEVLLHRYVAAVSHTFDRTGANFWHGVPGAAQQLEDPFPAIGTHIVSFEFDATEDSGPNQRKLLQQDVNAGGQAAQDVGEAAWQNSADEDGAAEMRDLSTTELHLYLHTRHVQQVLNNPIQAAFSAVPRHGYRPQSTGLKPAAVSPAADDDGAAASSSATDGGSSSNVHVLTL